MTNLEMWSLIVGFLLPPLLSVLMQKHWKPGFKAVVAFVGCLLAAVGTVLIQQDGWDGQKWLESALAIFIAAITSYKGLWKPVGVAPAIEDATTIKNGP
jgi:hypothetical protein